METEDFSGFTILVAEDDFVQNEYVRDLFQPTGLNILRASNGEEAIKSCRENPNIDLVLMDGMMPRVTGFDAAREIRKFRPDLPIILVTAYVSRASFREAVSSGCSDYLAKPVGPEELTACLVKWLKHRNPA
jgi:CheY-like chemotaxis protein